MAWALRGRNLIRQNYLHRCSLADAAGFHGSQEAESFGDDAPLGLRLVESGASFGLNRVVLALAAGFARLPARFDLPLSFEAVEDRIEHAVGPTNLAGGCVFDCLDQGVAVVFAAREDREKNWLGRGGHEFFG